MNRPFAASLVLAASAGLMPLTLAIAPSPASAALTTSAVAFAPERVDLAPKFTAGAESSVMVKLKISSTMPGSMGLPDMTSVDEHQVWLHEKVIEADPAKGATVEFTYERVALKVNTAMGKVDFDTKTGAGAAPSDPYAAVGNANDSVSPHMKKLIGEKVTVKFGADGQIASVDGDGDKGVEMLIGPACGLSPDVDSFKMLFGPIDSWDTEKHGKNMSVRTGDSWDHKVNMQVAPGMNASFVSKHTVGSISDDQATIDLTGKLEAPEKPDAYVLMKVKSSAASGRTDWDVKKQHMSAMNANLRYELTTSGMGEAMTTKVVIALTVERK